MKDYQVRMAFKNKNQLDWFLIWIEYYNENNIVVFARVIFSSYNWTGR